jgi:hypothetical protein
MGINSDQVRQAWIEKPNPAATASDHFAVGVELQTP